MFRRCWPDAPSQKLVAAVSATDSGPTMAALHISLPEIFSRHRASPTQWLPNLRTAYSGQRRPTEPVLRRVPQAGRCQHEPGGGVLRWTARPCRRWQRGTCEGRLLRTSSGRTSDLFMARHHHANQFCGFSLHAGHDVGILAEGEAWAFVAEAFADDLDWHVGAERDRGMSMP